MDYSISNGAAVLTHKKREVLSGLKSEIVKGKLQVVNRRRRLERESGDVNILNTCTVLLRWADSGETAGYRCRGNIGGPQGDTCGNENSSSTRVCKPLSVGTTLPVI